MLSKYLVLVLLLLSLAQVQSKKKCRALALEGGGTRGSFQAGVIKGFVDNLDPEEVKYDVVTGVSIGSINGGAFSCFAIGDEKSAINTIVDLWLNIERKDIYEKWKFGIPQALLFEPSLFDKKPMINLLKEVLYPLKNLKRNYTLGVCDENSGNYFGVNANKLNFSDVPEWISASCSMPGIFQYKVYGNKSFTDGGATCTIDLTSAVERCREVVDDDEDIIVDIIMNFNLTGEVDDVIGKHSLKVLARSLEIQKVYNKNYCLYDGIKGYPNVQWRYLVYPIEKLPGSNIISELVPLDFDPEHLAENIEYGQKEAKRVINTTSNSINNGPTYLKLIEQAKRSNYQRISTPDEFLNMLSSQ